MKAPMKTPTTRKDIRSLAVHLPSRPLTERKSKAMFERRISMDSKRRANVARRESAVTSGNARALPHPTGAVLAQPSRTKILIKYRTDPLFENIKTQAPRTHYTKT
ncbi:MAG: hypothetical protein FRX48_01641 [Lasallia pustulata]|uniref:Uncharacterized protein n=1 Tax=Lasallia pustulata TaxID=136370 RepID=A0A5M8PYQ7_9LECA|nr:MAG: hypothetical protein FRX48_01641 [Lasallia pustulata]